MEPSASTSHRRDIDGIRALAVLSVVFYHASIPGFSGGFAGVDIFFVISGYLITQLVSGAIGEGRFSFTDFYTRRIHRIFPALFATLLISIAIAFVMLIPSDLVKFGRSLIATVLFFSNQQFKSQVGYFDSPAAEKPLLHTWSLSVEEQFYAAWPVILLVLYRFLPARHVPIAIAALLVGSFALASWNVLTRPADAFYLLHNRAWELLLGAMITLTPSRNLSETVSTALSLLGLMLVLASFAFINSSMPFPGPLAAFPCAGAALLILTGKTRSTFATRLLGWGPLRFVGLISYSLYLVHWPAFSFAHIYLGHAPHPTETISLIALSFALAVVSWRYIETPFRQLRHPFRIAIAQSAIVATAIIAFALIYSETNGLPMRVPQGVRAADKEMQRNERRLDYCRPNTQLKFKGLTCDLGDQTRDTFDFVVWGDSHALPYGLTLDTMTRDRPLRGLAISLWSCPPFVNDQGTRANCPDQNAQIIEWITQQKA